MRPDSLQHQKLGLKMPELQIKTDKRVCFWGAPRSVPRQNRLTAQCLMETGGNTGNLFIGSGLFNATHAPVREYWDFYKGSPEQFDEMFDVLFIPASNFLFEHTDLSDQYEFFRKTKARMFMFGLGSQVRTLTPIKVPPGTENFIKLVAERSGSIGVRGEITADLVNAMGIRNVQVSGCPSLLQLPSTFSNKPVTLDAAVISGNFTNNARLHAFSSEALRKCESALFADLVKRGGYYVLQNERHEIKLRSILETSELLDDTEQWELNRVCELFDAGAYTQDVIEFVRWNTKLFFSVRDWLQFMSYVDFSFGTRFHGNIAAILAGKPAHIVCHDYRTLELCRFYKLPHSTVNSTDEVFTIADLVLTTDMDAFKQNIPKVLDLNKAFVIENGFEAIVLN